MDVSSSSNNIFDSGVLLGTSATAFFLSQTEIKSTKRELNKLEATVFRK